MRRPTRTLAVLALLAGAAALPGAAHARSGYYTSQSCNGCHGATSTCKGCHHHATPVSISGAKASYAPGEALSITVNGGGQGGWARAAILNDANAVLAQATEVTFPATVSTTAPTAPGTYTWKGAWYGNGYESGGAIGGAGYVADPNNDGHGWQPASFTFTVTAPAVQTPVAALSASTLDFGNVTVGQSRSLTAELQNKGNAALSVTSVKPCSNTAPPYAITPSGAFAVAAGGAQTLSIAFAPSSSGTAAGCFDFATNDPAHPTLRLSVTGAASAVASPNATLTPTTLAFGNVTVGQSATLTAQVGNTGSGTLRVTGITTCDSSSSPAFTLTPTAGFTVAPSVTQALTVRFAPTGAGAATGCYALATDDPAHSTLKLQLTGTGADATPPPPPQTCGSCHAIPPATGEHARHKSKNVGCGTCHGAGYSSTAVNGSTHRNGKVELAAPAGWNGAGRSCANACHGAESWGAGGGAPPPSGACGSCHAIPPASGKHAMHRREGVACSKCHGAGYSNNAVNAATHKNNTVELAASAGWNASRRSCANACHGSERWGGSSSTNPPTAKCGSCHGIPPGSGKHAKHTSKNISCSKCHGSGYSSTAVNAATHGNGRLEITSSAGWRASSRSCANSCHRGKSWGSSSSHDDDDDDDDDRRDRDDDEDLSLDASEQAGGCSSAGGPLSLLALSGIALLGIRRRRRD